MLYNMEHRKHSQESVILGKSKCARGSWGIMSPLVDGPGRGCTSRCAECGWNRRCRMGSCSVRKAQEWNSVSEAMELRKSLWLVCRSNGGGAWVWQVVPLKPGQGSVILLSEPLEARAVSVRTRHPLAKPLPKSNVIVLNYTLGQNHRRAQGPVPITLAPLCIFDFSDWEFSGAGELAFILTACSLYWGVTDTAGTAGCFTQCVPGYSFEMTVLLPASNTERDKSNLSFPHWRQLSSVDLLDSVLVCILTMIIASSSVWASYYNRSTSWIQVNLQQGMKKGASSKF